MAITVNDSIETTTGGSSGRGYYVLSTNDAIGAVVPHPHGNLITWWSIEDPATLSEGITIDTSTQTSIAATNTDQVNPRIVAPLSSTTCIIINYDSGNCYLVKYDNPLTGLYSDCTQYNTAIRTWPNSYSLGTGASNVDVNQAMLLPVFLYLGVCFNDDVLFFDPGLGFGPIVLKSTLSIGGRAHGLCLAKLRPPGIPAYQPVYYVTSRDNCELQAWIYNSGSEGTGIPSENLFTVSTGGTEALNVHVSTIAFIVGVLVIDGADSLIKIFDSITGDLLGTYLNESGGTIVDFQIDSWCMYVITDAETDNIHSVNISDPSSLTFELNTIPDGYDLSTILSEREVESDAGNSAIKVFATNPDTSNVVLFTLFSEGCGPDATVESLVMVGCFTLGNYLYTIETSVPSLRIYDLDGLETPMTAPGDFEALLVGTLTLEAVPTSIWVDQTNAVISYNDRIDMIDVDDPAAPTLLSKITAPGNWERVQVVTGNSFVTGTQARMSLYDLTSDPEKIIDKIGVKNGGFSSTALRGRRIMLVDTASSGDTAKLRSYKLGGFSCDFIRTSELDASTIQGERLDVTSGQFSGDVSADTYTTERVSTKYLRLGNSTALAVILSGTGTPEGNTAAPEGSLYLNTNGTPPVLYIKESGTDTSTGWVSK